MTQNQADSVRLALPREAADIAAIQRRAWELAFAEIGSEMLDELNLDMMTQVWEVAINRPPLASCRVLVALEGEQVVGFASTTPSEDPDAAAGEDGLVGEFIIDPAARGRGHGSRLLNAVVDTLVADGFIRANFWVASTDDDLRAFITESGWAADGAYREIGEDDGPRIKQVRLHTAIGPVA